MALTSVVQTTEYGDLGWGNDIGDGEKWLDLGMNLKGRPLGVTE